MMLRVNYSTRWCDRDGNEGESGGFVVEVYGNSLSGCTWYWIAPDHRSLVFARRKDAEIAKEALERAGVTAEALLRRDDPERIVQIMTRDLQW